MRHYRHRKRFHRKRRGTARRRRGPTHRSMGFGRGLLGDKPKELVIHRGLGFPARLRTKLRYVETPSITNTAGVINSYVFAANGLFDPNITQAGHQPMYFDQYMTVYDHYKVLGSKISVRPTVNGTSLVNPVFCTIIQNDDYSIAGASSFPQVIEWGLLDAYRIIGGAYVQGHKAMTCKYSAKRVYKDKYQSDSLIGDVSSNPTETTGFIIVQQPMDAASTVTIQYEVIIDYIVDFFELRDVAQS